MLNIESAEEETSSAKEKMFEFSLL